MKHLVLILFLLLSLCAFAQEEWQNPNFRTKKIAVQDSVVLDSLFILTEGLEILDFNQKKIPSNKISVSKNLIYLQDLEVDSLIVNYYVHPDSYTRIFYPKDTALIVSSSNASDALILNNTQQIKPKLFDGLNSKGSLVRGLILGNNQGSTVQSSLNLQLTGKLSDEVGIKAFISDTNTPIEVGGYTQTLEQFERIFIELFTDNSHVRAGHIDLNQSDEYFGKFNRKVMGIQLDHTIKNDNSVSLIEASGSMSRGQYSRFEFIGIDGNQGPYRIRGDHYENYVLIIAGSERVYRNGILLELGENRDYIIDYNTGEIQFTNKSMVTSNDRYIIEYQYTNRNYNRMLWYGGIEHTRNRFNISSHVYSESDNKNSPINQTLSENDKLLLSKAGDNIDQIFVDSGVLSEYSADKILYKKIDLGNDYIYEYANNPNEKLYQVNFTYLGDHKGNYIIGNSELNGRVFEYIPPINGLPSGDYSPVIPLVAPQKKQVISLASSYNFSKNGALRLDMGVSNFDRNLFSDINSQDNMGVGGRISGYRSFRHKNLQIRPEISLEYIQDNFEPIERLRTPEFARSFNLKNELGKTDQYFISSSTSLIFNDSTIINYGLDYLNQPNYYDGIRHRIGTSYNFKDYLILGEGSLLKTKTTDEQSSFIVYNTSVQKQYKPLLVKTGLLGENYNNRKVGNDSLSFQWNEIYTSVTIGDSLQSYAQMRLYYRTSDSLRLGEILNDTDSWGISINSKLIQQKNHHLEILLAYRNVNYKVISDNPSYLNADLNWRKSMLNRGVNANFKYGLAGTSEQQRAFTYAKVADGLGIYQWIDFNKDGIQQIDEFSIAEFVDQANYMRVYTGLIQTIRTNQNLINLNVNIQPSKFLITEFYKRLQANLAYYNQSNFLKENNIAVWYPWQDEQTLRNRNSNLFIQAYYNRGSKYKWHFKYELQNQKNTNLNFTGLESIKKFQNSGFLTYDWTTIIKSKMLLSSNVLKSNSQAFLSKRYHLRENEWSPSLEINLANGLISKFSYEYKSSQNLMGIENLRSNQMHLSLDWRESDKTNLTVNLGWVKNQMVGNSINLVANRMMNGLKKGSNFIWNLNMNKKINEFITFNILYSGRKNEGLPAIHTGNMQIRMNF